MADGLSLRVDGLTAVTGAFGSPAPRAPGAASLKAWEALGKRKHNMPPSHLRQLDQACLARILRHTPLKARASLAASCRWLREACRSRWQQLVPRIHELRATQLYPRALAKFVNDVTMDDPPDPAWHAYRRRLIASAATQQGQARLMKRFAGCSSIASCITYARSRADWL